jgi:glycosyltransferase involved in cell wall biosynthesis
VTPQKRVLVVHYFFPPLGGAGVPRVLKFVKYLPELGWDVAVVTSQIGVNWYAPRDAGRLAEVPASVRVTRAGEIPIAPLRRKLLGVLRRLGVPQIGSYIAWPDETVGWLPPAMAKAYGVARSWRPDVLLSSSYPYTAHFVALVVSRALGVPWVADFRDPWTHNPQADRLPRPLPALNRITERALVRHAHRIVIVDERMELVGLAPDDPRRVIIRNGVDEADFDPVSADEPQPPRERFRLTYVGSLYGDRDAAAVFESIKRLAATGAIDPAPSRCRWSGTSGWEGAPLTSGRCGSLTPVMSITCRRSAQCGARPRCCSMPR